MADKRPSSGTHSTQIDVVQVDGLVALKIVKHCQDEGSAGDVVQGVLLGLIQDKKLEVTNCFPFPKADDEDDEDSTLHYQMEMMRRLRAVNIDHLHVGWYQSTYLGSFLNKALLDSQYSYQKAIEESVVLIYDPLRTAQGMLSLRAYRLSKNMMDLYKDGEFTPERIAKKRIGFDSMFEEIPLVVKNSTLENALLCELEEQGLSAGSDRFLSLATGSYLEKNVRLLMESVDEMCQDSNKYHNYQRNLARQQQQKDAYLQRRQAENASRQTRGEPPLPDEDLSKIFKPLPAPSRLESLLLAGQINAYSHQVNHFATQSFGKLFLAEALQEKRQ